MFDVAVDRSGAAVQGAGRFFEDFTVGDLHRHPLGRTINEADNTWFTLLTMNTHPLHFDSAYAAETEFGRPVVNSGFSVALVLGLSVSDISQQAIANLGWEDIALPHPLFVGDTVYADSEVLEVRPSASRPGAGVLTVRTRGYNQQGTVCVRFRRSALVRGRSSGSPAAGRPEAAGW